MEGELWLNLTIIPSLFDESVTGTMGFKDAIGYVPPGRATLYKLNDTGCFQNLDPVLPGVTISNGIAWNDDSTRMYYIDSPTRQIALFDYDSATATICNYLISFMYWLYDNFDSFLKKLSMSDKLGLSDSQPQNVLRLQDG